MTETIQECEARIGRKLTKGERAFKKLLDSECACGHNGHAHAAPVLGGPLGYPCWATGCPCYSFPEGLTADEKHTRRFESSTAMEAK